MGTGDLAGNVARLLRELQQLRYGAPVDEVGLRLGDPIAFLPLLHYTLLRFSKHVAQCIAKAGFEMQGKTDRRFVETAFRLFRDCLGVRTVLTAAQFLEQGFAERKVLLLCEVIQICKKVHNDEVRKERLAALKSRSGPPKSFARPHEPSSSRALEVKVIKGGHETRQVVSPVHLPNATGGGQSVYAVRQTSPLLAAARGREKQDVAPLTPATLSKRGAVSPASSHQPAFPATAGSPYTLQPSLTAGPAWLQLPQQYPCVRQEGQQAEGGRQQDSSDSSLLYQPWLQPQAHPAFPATTSSSYQPISVASQQQQEQQQQQPSVALAPPIHSWFVNPAFASGATEHDHNLRLPTQQDQPSSSVHGGGSIHDAAFGSFAFQPDLHAASRRATVPYPLDVDPYSTAALGQGATAAAAAAEAPAHRPWQEGDGGGPTQPLGVPRQTSSSPSCVQPEIGHITAHLLRRQAELTHTHTYEPPQPQPAPQQHPALILPVGLAPPSPSSPPAQPNGPSHASALADMGNHLRQAKGPMQALAKLTHEAAQTLDEVQRAREQDACIAVLSGQVEDLKLRLESTQQELQESRREALETRDTLTARVTVLEGRLRFLECEVAQCVRTGAYQPNAQQLRDSLETSAHSGHPEAQQAWHEPAAAVATSSDLTSRHGVGRALREGGALATEVPGHGAEPHPPTTLVSSSTSMGHEGYRERGGASATRAVASAQLGVSREHRPLGSSLAGGGGSIVPQMVAPNPVFGFRPTALMQLVSSSIDAAVDAPDPSVMGSLQARPAREMEPGRQQRQTWGGEGAEPASRSVTGTSVECRLSAGYSQPTERVGRAGTRATSDLISSLIARYTEAQDLMGQLRQST